MKLTLLVVGKTDERFMKEGIELYKRRLKHYVDFNIEIVPDIKKTKSLSPDQQRQKEGERILSKWASGKEFHLFDEKGVLHSSRSFAGFLEKKMLSGMKELVLVIGGPYGFSPQVEEKAVSRISLSRMTFSHQLARLLCVEQIYRAFTILKGESYHHD